MRIDPDVAQRMYDACQQALGAMQYPDDRRTLRRASSALQSAVDRARNSDEANREWIQTTMSDVGGRMPHAGDFTAMTEALPARRGRYGS